MCVIVPTRANSAKAAQIAQLVEQQTENLRVPRSIRGLGTTNKPPETAVCYCQAILSSENNESSGGIVKQGHQHKDSKGHNDRRPKHDVRKDLAGVAFACFLDQDKSTYQAYSQQNRSDYVYI